MQKNIAKKKELNVLDKVDVSLVQTSLKNTNNFYRACKKKKNGTRKKIKDQPTNIAFFRFARVK